MTRLMIIMLFLGVLGSCNPSEETNSSNKETQLSEDTDSNKQLVAITSEEALIATALNAAPEASREGCTVIGYNLAGEFVTFREGDNEFIVLVDDSKRDGFNAACYHKDLEPFMARGRELRAEGKTSKEIFDIREAEAKSGELDMGNQGSTLHLYYGSGELYDPETFEVAGAQYRYVVYLPFATAASTGLPEKPVGVNHPWIMNPGTHRAHIMITPLPDKAQE